MALVDYVFFHLVCDNVLIFVFSFLVIIKLFFE